MQNICLKYYITVSLSLSFCCVAPFLDSLLVEEVMYEDHQQDDPARDQWGGAAVHAGPDPWDAFLNWLVV